jgi:putative peptidoglycan lipid II flippase
MSESRHLRSRSLARGAMLTTVATAASRVTGFVRVVVVASALGTTFLANTYQTANTAPNIVFELVAAGVLTSIFVPTFVEYLARDRAEAGWVAANALTSVALVALIAMSLLVALAAPLIMRALTIGVDDPELRAQEIGLGSTFLRLFSPQIAFYGVGMIMTGALHAHRHFAMPALAPIFNNVVVIAVYLTYIFMRGDRAPTVDGITTAETFVLGAGTTLGVVAMTVCLVPQLRRLGWRYRFKFDTSHPAVRKGARLGIWALGYAGGYQAGLIVVLMLANSFEGGVAAYQWAYTFFYLPHALFAIPVFNVLFTAMAEHAVEQDAEALRGRLHDGLGMLAFFLLPVAAGMLATAHLLTRLTLEYGVMTGAGANLVARVLIGFAVGLPVYSVFLVYTRAYYAIGDTRTPTLINAATVAISSAVGAVLFATLQHKWKVPGLAIGHSIGFAIGAVAFALLFARRIGPVRSPGLVSEVVRAFAVTALALGAMLGVRALLPSEDIGAAVVALAATVAAGAALYLIAMRQLGSSELRRIVGFLTRSRSGAGSAGPQNRSDRR